MKKKLKIFTIILFFSFANVSIAAPRTAFVHLFEWKWNDVAKECVNYLGPMGYAAVQVSPPTEHRILPGRPWYERYQIVSYKFQTRSGNLNEFVNMVRTCKTAGVDIYVDIIINHMGQGALDGSVEYGTAGTAFRNYEYPGLYSKNDFNNCGLNGNNRIMNFDDRYEVQFCELVNLPDLNTSSYKVRATIISYINYLTSLGVAGFRVDAAKHIPSEDLQAIYDQVNGFPYFYQEVIDYGQGEIRASEYFDLGDVTEFNYVYGLNGTFKNGRLASLQNFGEGWGFMPSHVGIVFIDGHDDQRISGKVLTHKEWSLYRLINIFMLAWPYGYPRVMSSYSFSYQYHEQGPPQDEFGNILSVYGKYKDHCFNEWVCEHRTTAISNMVAFRNNTTGSFYVSKWWSNGNNQIAFSRGDKGFVAINREGFRMINKVKTDLAPGVYCNILDGNKVFDKCTGSRIIVNSDFTVDINIAPYKALATYREQRISI